MTNSLHPFTAKAATAAAFGNTEYWHCDVCDTYFSNGNATKEITLANTVISKLAPKIIAGDGTMIAVFVEDHGWARSVPLSRMPTPTPRHGITTVCISALRTI